MGAAFEVYNDRDYGLAEEIYQECLEFELELRGIAAGIVKHPCKLQRFTGHALRWSESYVWD